MNDNVITLPETGSEEYYSEQEEFIRYVIDTVNPARKRHSLMPIRKDEAKECYRILHEFLIQWNE